MKGRLFLWKHSTLVQEWEAQGITDFKCSMTSNELRIVGRRGQELIRMVIDVKAPEIPVQECILKVNFTIARFQIFPRSGWQMAYDSVAGILHLFDSINARYKGFLKIDKTQTKIYARGSSQFQVFTRKFNPDSLVFRTYLNTCSIGVDQISLIASVPMAGNFEDRWIVTEPAGNHYAVISTSQTRFQCQLDFCLPLATMSFATATLDGHALATTFAGASKMIIALSAPQGARLCEFDLTSNSITQSIALDLENITSSYEVDSAGSVFPLSAPEAPLDEATQVSMLECASPANVFFVLDTSPRLLLHWARTKTKNSRLITWRFPAPIESIAVPHPAIINAVCIAANPPTLSYVTLTEPFSVP